MHFLMVEMLNMMAFDDFKSLQKYVCNSLPTLFNCSYVHLWSLDYSTGILTTHDENGQETRILATSGIFKDVLENRHLIDSI